MDNIVTSANKKKAQKEAAKKRPQTWKPGQSGNPKGRPKDGESWASVLSWASTLTGEEAAEHVPPQLAAEFRKLKGLQLKQAISLRVMASLLFEPTSALFNAVMDRIDGKVPDNININDWRKEAAEAGYDPDELVRQFAEAMVAARVERSGETGGGDNDVPMADDSPPGTD